MLSRVFRRPVVQIQVRLHFHVTGDAAQCVWGREGSISARGHKCVREVKPLALPLGTLFLC
jgi:hypothetical protein